jgi:DNA-binding GntR family transcriptional regulator
VVPVAPGGGHERPGLDLNIAKDGDSAERVMREHVRASRQALLAGLESAR